MLTFLGRKVHMFFRRTWKTLHQCDLYQVASFFVVVFSPTCKYLFDESQFGARHRLYAGVMVVRKVGMGPKVSEIAI